MPESTRPIRALIRGLEALTVMNRQDSVTVTEVATAIRLPRTTSYRILETLCDAGYAYRDQADERYRLTDKVTALALAADGTVDLARRATPALAELAREVRGTALLALRRNDRMTTIAIASHRGETPALPPDESLTHSALGLAWLAACPATECKQLIKYAAASLPARELELLRQHGLAVSTDEARGRTRVARALADGEQLLAVLALEFDAAQLAANKLSALQLDPLGAALPRIKECFQAPGAKV